MINKTSESLQTMLRAQHYPQTLQLRLCTPLAVAPSPQSSAQLGWAGLGCLGWAACLSAAALCQGPEFPRRAGAGSSTLQLPAASAAGVGGAEQAAGQHVEHSAPALAEPRPALSGQSEGALPGTVPVAV